MHEKAGRNELLSEPLLPLCTLRLLTDSELFDSSTVSCDILLHKVIEGGKRLTKTKTLQELQAYVKKQLDNEIWEEEQRFENPHKHYIDMSPDYYEMKMSMLHNIRTV